MAAVTVTVAPVAATVHPAIAGFSPVSGVLGSSVTISGTHLAGATAVTFDGVSASFSADTASSVKAKVPAGASTGPIAVTTAGGTASSTTSFSVKLSLLVAPTTAPPSSSVAVSGSGFGHSETVDLAFDGTASGSVSTDSHGTFTGAAVAIPASATAGSHTVTATGRNSGRTAKHTLKVRVDWPQFHDGPTHTGYNASENVLKASNVAQLTVDWTATLGSIGAHVGSPTVAGGVVYEAFNKLYAFPVACGTGGAHCSPTWVGKVPNGSSAAPAVANGEVYIGGLGKLLAFKVGCGTGGATCLPLWTATTPDAFDASPTVADGVVYAATENSPDGGLYAYPADCGTGGATCDPIWHATLAGSSQFSSPAVAGGVVYVGTLQGYLYAFAVGCASGGAVCLPLWKGTTSDSDAPPGESTSAIDSSPAVAGGMVFVGSIDGLLYAYPASCSDPCAPTWTGVIPNPSAGVKEVYSSPAVANGVVYVGSTGGYLAAFSATCGVGGASCSPIWIGRTTTAAHDVTPIYFSSPAVAGGVVYVGSFNGGVFGYKVGCGTGGATCDWLWKGQTGDGIDESSPAVVDGMVYIGSVDGKLYAYGLP